MLPGMDGAPSLIVTLLVALAVAYVGGLAARAARLPPIVGYLLAGVVVSPSTPGLSADARTVEDLAQIGVVLLLFGVGLHFSLADLRAVWRIAVPGALLQIALSFALASTVVATRALEERGRLMTDAGRIALGWLVMQDLVAVLVLVVLPGGTPSPFVFAGAPLAVGALK